jgi:hypothetical protein
MIKQYVSRSIFSSLSSPFCLLSPYINPGDIFTMQEKAAGNNNLAANYNPARHIPI